jgi:outer membrane protein assembly factor BamB
MLRKSITVAAAGALFGSLAIAGSVAPAGAVTLRPADVSPAAAPGAQLWVQRYQGSSDNSAVATSIALSPNGKVAFVTGGTLQGSTEDWTTIAYSAATDAQLWIRNFATPVGAAAPPSSAEAIAVSPNGKTLYVTGRAFTGGNTEYFVTIAYNAATGAKLWSKGYNPDAYAPSGADSVVVSPNGKMVYVSGSSPGVYATVAYNAATGARLWVRRVINITAEISVVVSPNGKEVLVSAGGSDDPADDGYYVTSAYNAATGAKLWSKNYTGPEGPKGGSSGTAHAIAVSPNGKAVFVTGGFYHVNSSSAYVTIAYNVITGAQLWVKSSYSDSYGDVTAASSVAVSPNGKDVYVTGDAEVASEFGGNAVTIAYSAATGAQLWAKSYDGGSSDLMTNASSVAVSPDGKTVYVTGSTSSTARTATVAYSAATGAQLWAENYNPGGNDDSDITSAMAVGPSGVFVTGNGRTYDSSYYLTIAYAS